MSPNIETDADKSAKIESALGYLSHGLALVPVGNDKRPYCDFLEAGWQDRPPNTPFSKTAKTESLIRKVLRYFTRHRASNDDIEVWFRRNPDVNVSAICGSASGGLVVLDLDSADPEGCMMPRTPRVNTVRGSHIHLKTNCRIRSCDLYFRGKKIGHLIAEGGYAPMPPSRHASGSRYAWAKGLSPAELDWQYAQPPGWVLESWVRHQSTRNRWNKAMTRVRAPLMAAAATGLLGLLSSMTWFLLGLPFVICGEIIQIMAASHLKQQVPLTTSGPYAHVRNPMYMGRFLVGLGFTLMSGAPIICAIFALLYALYATSRVKREESRLQELHEQAYEDYRACVPRWVPRVRPYPLAEQVGPRWSQIRKNHEHRVAAALAAVLTAIYLKLIYLPDWRW